MAATDPKKDVIYVDIEDDITSVIEKVKGASASIVALVPPKRIGVLQSVVNLKLLQRAAASAKKRVVLITNDQALVGLAAGLAMPVAKNLQSRPEVPAAAATRLEDEEVINGADLPVGELAKTADEPLDLSDLPTTNAPGAAAMSAPFAAKAAERAPKKGSTIPNFDSFRKKIFIFGGAGALLFIFLVWAIFFAGKATIAIAAKTNVVNINKTLQLRETAKLDAAQGVVPATVKVIKKTNSTDFTATGKKEVGEKATGPVSYSNADPEPTTIPAGTQLAASNGLAYTTTAAVTVPGATLSFTCPNYLCPGSASGTVAAVAGGSKYNGASGGLSGEPDGISASFSSPTSGGTDKTATVVSQADFDKAAEKLEAEDSNKIKNELRKEFDDAIVIINESFNVEPGEPSSAPAIGQEATAAKLTAETTYTLVGITRAHLRAVYDTYTKAEIAGETNQKIYESGDEVTSFTEFTKTDKGFTVRAQAVAQVGPNIDDKALATQLTGKRAGEIQQQIEMIQGVEDVTVKFSPFWVTKAPMKADKITIKFVVKHD